MNLENGNGVTLLLRGTRYLREFEVSIFNWHEDGWYHVKTSQTAKTVWDVFLTTSRGRTQHDSDFE